MAVPMTAQASSALDFMQPSKIPGKTPDKTKDRREEFETRMYEQAAFLAKAVTSLSSNPMDPMKPQETLKMVQDMTNSRMFMEQAMSLDQLSKGMQMNNLLVAGSLAGQEVEVQDDRFKVVPINLQYHLPEAVAGAFVDILDAQGSLIKSLQVNPDRGQHGFEFDPLDAYGRRLSPGTYGYQMRVIPRGADVNSEQVLFNQSFDVWPQQQKASYILPQKAKQCTLTLETLQGHVLCQWDGSLESGKHDVDLFELLSLKGGTLPQGDYRFRAYAVDQRDQPLETQTLMRIQVEGVEAGDQGPSLRYQGGQTLPLDRYRSLNRIHDGPTLRSQELSHSLEQLLTEKLKSL